MIRVRPIANSDFNALKDIAVASGPGFTSLPEDDEKLKAKIARSVASFASSKDNLPENPLYLFVAQDMTTGECAGISAIEANIGAYPPLYHFHKSRHLHYSPSLNMQRELEILSLCNEYAGVSEVCSLYVKPEYRQSHAGRLLSKVRFLFMADFPEFFASRIIAEMRGYEDESGHSPFWRWIQKQFLPIEFATIDRLVGLGQRGFIAEMMPRYPLYLNMIDAQAREVIGRVHKNTQPALAMLKREGFDNRGYFDLFDAGPTVEAKLQDINTVRSSDSYCVHVQHSLDVSQAQKAMITNSQMASFKAIVAEAVVINRQNNTLTLTPDTASQLAVSAGQAVRFIPC